MAFTLPCFVDLSPFVLIQQELCGLSRWVDDQRVTIEPLQHDSILCTQIVCWQGIRLPLETLIGSGQIL